MVHFKATIKQFATQGEKTGWSYIEIPADLAEQLYPGNRKSFRVKGKLDKVSIKQQSVLPMGGGSFIMALNGTIRKKLGKNKGAMLEVAIQHDPTELEVPSWITECLDDDPDAKSFFETLPKGHQNYFIKWIESAKTEETKAKRMAQMLNGLARKWGFGEMIRANKNSRTL